MKEQIKTPEKELNNKEIANLSDVQFKTLIIRMPREMTEYSHKIKEEVKATQSEIKKNIQETNREGMETGIQINNLDQKEETNLWGSFKRSNIRIRGVPEGEEEEQEFENLFENIMKENFPNLAKEI